jgi:hypothetical protein
VGTGDRQSLKVGRDARDAYESETLRGALIAKRDRAGIEPGFVPKELQHSVDEVRETVLCGKLPCQP